MELGDSWISRVEIRAVVFVFFTCYLASNRRERDNEEYEDRCDDVTTPVSPQNESNVSNRCRRFWQGCGWRGTPRASLNDVYELNGLNDEPGTYSERSEQSFRMKRAPSSELGFPRHELEIFLDAAASMANSSKLQRRRAIPQSIPI